MVAKGDTFLMADNSGGNHLAVVVTPPIAHEKGDVVVVTNVSEDRPDKDQTCKLAAGSHPFITVPSVVMYEKTKQVIVSYIDTQCARGQFKMKPPASAVMLAAICCGFQTTPALQDLPTWLVQVLRSQGLIV